MNNLLSSSVFFATLLTIAIYVLFARIQQKTKITLLHPLLLSILSIILILRALDIPYKQYAQHASNLSHLLTPATICLAIPFYEQFALLKKHMFAVICGILCGIFINFLSILLLCRCFSFPHTAFVTLLPKSITSAIGMDLSATLGGHPPITITLIIMTGILGNMLAAPVCRFFRITDPIAKGIAIGTSSHAIGTAKAIETSPICGAVSSLALILTGLLTVFLAPLFSALF